MYDMKDQSDTYKHLQLIPYPGHVTDEDESTPLKYISSIC